MTSTFLRASLAPAALILLLLTGAAVAQRDSVSAGGTCLTPAVQGSSHVLAFDPPVIVPDVDAGGVNICMAVQSTAEITDLNVGLEIEHRYPGDLVITLRHETSGTAITLVDRPGRPGLNALGCGEFGDDISAVLDDEASATFEDTCEPTTPTISGVLRPTDALSAFDGETLGGTWILHLRDEVVGDAGAVNEWSLIAGTSAGDVDCSTVVNSVDAALVLQHVAGLVLTLACQENADVNGSGGVNSIDATLILQHVAGLIPSLPA